MLYCRWFREIEVDRDGWVSRGDLLLQLRRHGIKPISRRHPMDTRFRLPTKGSLQSLAQHLVYPAGWAHDHPLVDCDKYALQAHVDAARQDASIVMATGWMIGPLGLEPHAFSLTMDRDDLDVHVMENSQEWPWAGRWYTPASSKRDIFEGHYYVERVLV